MSGDSPNPCSPSPLPPAGLKVAQVPQFVAFGFDDNGLSGLPGAIAPGGGLSAVCAMFGKRTNPAGSNNPRTYDGQPTRFSFFPTAHFISGDALENPVYNKRAWRLAAELGHEIGIHTYSHHHGAPFSSTRWRSEIEAAVQWIAKPFDPAELPQSPDADKGIGIPPGRIFGFRAPYLEYNDAMLSVIEELGFAYDCSIQEGMQEDQDGATFLWPYTLERGSPGNDATTHLSTPPPLGRHPGLWELPVYAVIVPPDDHCASYGVAPGLRRQFARRREYFNAHEGKITGIDWNLWVDFSMSTSEFLATLKYTLDLRLAGNRCPLLFGAHSDIYSDAYPKSLPNASGRERREALAELLDYAVSKPQARVVTFKELLDWMGNPAGL
jgi:peptidoglycan/xylan/chitin deacetylase (PgdA/CDA1 family)